MLQGSLGISYFSVNQTIPLSEPCLLRFAPATLRSYVTLGFRIEGQPNLAPYFPE